MKNTFLTTLFLLLALNGFAQNLKLNIRLNDSLNMNFDKINYIKEHNNAKSVQLELNLYNNKLNHLGYLNHQIVSFKTINKNFNYTIQLNRALEKLTVHLTEKQDSLLKKIAPNIVVKDSQFSIPFHESEYLLENMKQKLYNIGCTFVKVKLENISIEDSVNATAYLSIHYSKKRSLDQLIINGYPSFPKTFIKYKLNFPNKNPFNDVALQDIGTTLSKIPFISIIKPAELLFTRDSTKLYLYLEKKSNSSFQGILGISSNDSKKTSIYGYLNLKLSNAFNKGELITLDWNKTSERSQKLVLSSTFPYLLKTPISSRLYLNISKIDSSYTNTNSMISFYRTRKRVEYGFGYSNLKSKVAVSLGAFSNFTQNSLFVYFNYKEDSKISVFKHKSLYTINIKHGKINVLGNNELNLRLAKLIKLKVNNFLYLSSNSRYSSLQSSSLPNKNKLLGGVNTLKGFGENQFLTNNYSIFDIEYRYLLSKNLYTTLGSQLAYLEQINSSISTLSLGASLNIKQKNGLLSIMYNLGKTNNTSFKLGNSKINISFLTFF